MSSHVAIRPLEWGDVPRLFAAARESIAEVHPWMAWCHADYCEQESREWIERQIALFREGAEHAFAIVSDDGSFLGGCGLNAIDSVNRRANLGYWVRSSATRRGVASAAVRLLAAWAFAHTDLVRLEIVVAVDNVASLRAAQRAGAVQEGVLRKRLLLHGTAHDAAVFSIVRSDLPQPGVARTKESGHR
jgi:ribosomal-protein-serine acetyltransferase